MPININMNKKIILGNSEGILVDYDTKQKVIDWLYLKLDLSKYRYIIMNNVSKLKFLQDNRVSHHSKCRIQFL